MIQTTMGITIRGEKEPTRMATPTNMVINPRYIGFLVRRNGPAVTRAVAFIPGRGGVPDRRKRLRLTNARKNPIAITTIPIYLHGACNQRAMGANEFSTTIKTMPTSTYTGGTMRGMELFVDI